MEEGIPWFGPIGASHRDTSTQQLTHSPVVVVVVVVVIVVVVVVVVVVVDVVVSDFSDLLEALMVIKETLHNTHSPIITHGHPPPLFLLPFSSSLPLPLLPLLLLTQLCPVPPVGMLP